MLTTSGAALSGLCLGAFHKTSTKESAVQEVLSWYGNVASILQNSIQVPAEVKKRLEAIRGSNKKVRGIYVLTT